MIHSQIIEFEQTQIIKTISNNTDFKKNQNNFIYKIFTHRLSKSLQNIYSQLSDRLNNITIMSLVYTRLDETIVINKQTCFLK